MSYEQDNRLIRRGFDTDSDESYVTDVGLERILTGCEQRASRTCDDVTIGCWDLYYLVEEIQRHRAAGSVVRKLEPQEEEPTDAS